MTTTRTICVVLNGLVAAAVCTLAHAQGFPAQPIKLIVPFPPGGGSDLLARAISPQMAEILGQPVVIDNRAGAGGNIGLDIGAKSPADGYTIMIAPNQLTVNPALGIKTPFNVERDFAPVGLIASVPIILVANPSQPFDNLVDFIGYARSNPGKISYSSAGSGTPNHLAGEVFAKMTNTSMVHVPYRGTAPAVADVVGGQVQVTFGTLSSVSAFIDAGKLRALGVAGQKRSRILPKLPTFEEAGLKGYDAELWFCLLAPSKTPAARINKLNAALNQALKNPQVSTGLISQGFESATSTPEQLKAKIAADVTRWTRVVKEYQIKIEP